MAAPATDDGGFDLSGAVPVYGADDAPATDDGGFDLKNAKPAYAPPPKPSAADRYEANPTFGNAYDTALESIDANNPVLGALAGVGHSIAAGTAGLVGKLAGRVVDALPPSPLGTGADYTGAPRKADTWGEGAASVVPSAGPVGQAVEQKIGEGTQAVSSAVDKIPGVNTPLGQTVKEAGTEAFQDLGLLSGARGAIDEVPASLGGKARAPARVEPKINNPVPEPAKAPPKIEEVLPPKEAAPQPTEAPAPVAAKAEPTAPPAAGAAPAPAQAVPDLKPGDVWTSPTTGVRYEIASDGKSFRAVHDSGAPMEGASGVSEPLEGDPKLNVVLRDAELQRAGVTSSKGPAAAKTASAEAPAAEAAPADPVASRAKVLKQLGFDNVRGSALDNDRMSGATDYQLTASDTKQGRQAAAIFEEERQRMNDYAGKLVEQAGGTEDIVDSSARYARGQVHAKAIQAGYDNLNEGIKQVYKEADARANGNPQPLDGLSGILTKERSSFTATQEGTHLLQGLQDRIREMGLAHDDGSIRPATPAQAERLRQFIGDNYSPRTARLVSKLQDAIDDDVTKNAGEDLYGASRALRRQRDQLYDKPSVVKALLEPKPGEKRPWDFSDVGGNLAKAAPDELKKFVDVLREQSKNPKLRAGAEASLHELRGQLAQELRNAGNGAGTASKQHMWDDVAYSKKLAANRQRMKLVFTPDEMRQFDLLDKGGKILHVDRTFKGSVVQAHNIAMRGVDLALEHAPELGALAGHVPGMIIGGAAKGLAKAIKEPSAVEMRPLGAKVGGGKQRGAVGDLSVREKASPFVHSIDDMGDHVVQTRDYVPNDDPANPTPKRGGRLIAEDKGDALQVRRSDVAPDQQRGGLGTGLVRAMADKALEQGKQFHSDFSVSKGATGTYGRLAGEGYDVRVNPHVKVPHTLEDGTPTHTLMTEDNQSPVFEIHSGPKSEPTPPWQK